MWHRHVQDREGDHLDRSYSERGAVRVCPDSQDPPVARQRRSTSPGAARVLVAVDEASVRNLLAAILTPQGYDATVACDGGQAKLSLRARAV